MNKAKRKAIIAGNWKMNNTPAQTTALINEMKPLVADADCEASFRLLFQTLNHTSLPTQVNHRLQR